MKIDDAKNKSPGFKTVDECIDVLMDDKFNGIIELITNWLKDAAEKNESNFVKYQHKDRTIDRVMFRDREHPVDTVILDNFNDKTDGEVEKARIIYGPGADEYTRSHHALAIAIADRIYFRNGAYKPETEEGQKLLAHELTHVAQNKNREDYRNVTVDQKETEAEKNEMEEGYKEDPTVTRRIRGKEYSLKKSEWKEIHAKALEEVENRIEQEGLGSDEEGKLILLLKYEKWLKEDEAEWEK